MVEVLREHGGVMHSEDLADVIAQLDLFRREDGAHASVGQLRARAVKYPHLLKASDDGSIAPRSSMPSTPAAHP